MATKKKIETRKSPRSWYRNDPAFVGIVQYCFDQNLSEKSSLKLIEEHYGRNISGRNFRRVKKILPMSNSDRIEIVNQYSASFIMESLVVLHSNENVLCNIAKDPNTNVWMKIKACETILKNRIAMGEFYDASPVIASLSELKGVNENAIQKPEETSKEKLS